MKPWPRLLTLSSGLLWLWVWPAAHAQSVTTPASTGYSGGVGGSAWYGLVTLTLLVVLVAVVLRVLKRVGSGGVSEGGVELLASKSLGPREFVVVVKVEGRHFMLGHTPSQVSLIAELDQFSPPTASQPRTTGRFGGDFAQTLSATLRKGGRS